MAEADWALLKANEIAPFHVDEWPLESKEMRQERVSALADAIAEALREERERSIQIVNKASWSVSAEAIIARIRSS